MSSGTKAALKRSPCESRKWTCDKPIDLLRGVKPQRGPKVCQIERSRRHDCRHRHRLTEVQRQIAQDETGAILRQAVESCLVSVRSQCSCPRQTDQVSSGLQHQQDTRQQFGRVGFCGQPLRSTFTEQDAQVRRRVEIQTRARWPLAHLMAQRSPRSSSSTAR
jgi:hypothetical protein